jgi:4-hydroxybenzoate polyprenyltransferase
MGGLERVRNLFLATHPGPSLAVTTVTLVLALTAGLPFERVILVTLAMLANQFSIGLSNDWLDAARDTRASRVDKPLAAGRLSPTLVRNVAFACVLVSLGLSAWLGLWVLLAQVIGLTAGWAYNLGLKATPISFVPYLVGFGILPVIVTLSSPIPTLAAPWVIAVAAILGVAAHFANAMPDIETDRSEGILGMPQRVGARASGIITYLVLLIGAMIAFAGPQLAPGRGGSVGTSPIQWIGLVLNLVVAAVGIGLVARLSPERPPSRLMFQLIMLAALANVAMIAVAGTSILA